MHPRTMMIPLALALGAAVSGCASTGAPQPVAQAASQECKVVAVYTAGDVLRNQNARGVPGSDIAKADGAADSGRIAAFPPAQIRSPSKLDSMPAQLARQC